MAIRFWTPPFKATLVPKYRTCTFYPTTTFLNFGLFVTLCNMQRTHHKWTCHFHENNEKIKRFN